MFLDGIRIKGYRSFGDEFVTLENCGKINIIAGANNCGKSNLLRFINKLNSFNKSEDEFDFNNELDTPKNTLNSRMSFSLQINQNSDDSENKNYYEKIRNRFSNIWNKVNQYEESIWIYFTVLKQRLKRTDIDTESNKEFTKTIEDTLMNFVKEVRKRNPSFYPGSIYMNYPMDFKELHRECMNALNGYTGHFDVKLIDGIREITASGASDHEIESEIYDGKGMRTSLLKLRNPEDHAHLNERLDQFNEIQNFVKEILNEDSVEIFPASDSSSLTVRINGKPLPIESLGTGIHELIILATAVTLHDNVIFCIEEPELHIHPILQKKFIEYLYNNTRNQYFITTHANSFFDIPYVDIYHCRLENDFTKCTKVKGSNDKLEILSDLGYKPSDLLLSNYVIWVEGPSDRIYLNHWIKSKDEKLKEGIHYSIMFYGGRLLSHLDYEDEKKVENDFIELAKLGRHSCILIDSDKKQKNSKLNATKERIKNAFTDNQQFVWITDCGEIENYLDIDNYNNAISKVHKIANKQKKHKYHKLTYLDSENTKSINKVLVAKKYVEIEANAAKTDNFDLNDRLNELVGKIKEANGVS